MYQMTHWKQHGDKFARKCSQQTAKVIMTLTSTQHKLERTLCLHVLHKNTTVVTSHLRDKTHIVCFYTELNECHLQILNAFLLDPQFFFFRVFVEQKLHSLQRWRAKWMKKKWRKVSMQLIILDSVRVLYSTINDLRFRSTLTSIYFL